MSWMKRPQAGEGASAGPQPYAAPQTQPFTSEQSMYPNYPGGAAGAQQPAQYWTGGGAGAAAAGYNQQYAQTYQQEYTANANHYQHQYNHNYASTGVGTGTGAGAGYADPSHNYQQNYYQNQPQQRYPPTQPAHADGWEDNWDWGWEESAKQAQKAQSAAQHAAAHHAPPQPDHEFNNANVLEESFAPTNTNTWNWAMDDKKGEESSVLQPTRQPVSNEPATLPPDTLENNMSPEPSNVQNVINGAPAPAEEVRTLGDRDAVKERMPNLALGKRFHLDNLTPQWSIESQMSQESSDGPQTHSESTYRSENQSRNSNSPGPNTDNSNFNYSQSGLDEGYSQNSELSKRSDEPTLTDDGQTGGRQESHEELARTMQDLTLVNRENPLLENIQGNREMERRNSHNAPVAPSVASAILPPPPASGSVPPPAAGPMPPPPPVASPARPPSASVVSPSPAPAPAAPTPSAAAGMLPPPSFAPLANSQNPFKHAGPFAHKPKTSSSAGPGQVFPGAGLASPAMVGKAAPASRTPIGFEANLETTPDNSERPDQPPAGAARSPPPPPAAAAAAPAPPPDNMEVAPRTERNEYLQTAHLSSGDYGENAQFAPPAGVRRVPVGRREEYGRADEPPPGLARMVPGRPTEGDGACDQPGDPYRERPDAYRRADGDYRAAGAWEPRVVPGFERDFPPAAAEREPPGDGAAWPPPERLDEPPERGAGSAGEPRAPDSPAERAPPEPAAADRDRRDSRDRERYPRAERDRDRDERKSSRDERRTERDDRRPERDRRDRRERHRDRRERDESPDARRKRRSARSHRYETEDTDYYSDKERERRRHREGSYSARPPRADDGRRHEERGPRARRSAAGAEPRDRHDRVYRDIDPHRKYGNRRRDRDRDEDRRRVRFSARRASSGSEGEAYSPASRGDSRENTATDEEPERRRERRPRHSSRRPLDPYYDVGYGVGVGVGVGAYGDPYLAQRQQYEYYERLRATDPAAYMQLYRRLMAARAPDPAAAAAAALHDTLGGYGAGARDERASVHSGRSSAHGLHANDTYYMFRQESLRDAPSLRTDLSDRDLNTDVSLPTNLETSTVRSERMTPHRFSTAHVKGSISSRHVVVVRESWPVDGRPATVQLVSLRHAMQRDPRAAELLHSPGPLVKGVTHKKSVIEYCAVRARSAAREGGADPLGYALLWDLLALLLTQNGVVVGSDIAELLMKNTREHEYKPPHEGSRRGSSGSGSCEEARSSPDYTEPSAATNASNEWSPASVDEKAALDRLRELLLYGNRQEALEWAMSSNLWGHALHLAAYSERRTRGAVAARFLAAVPRRDPLHTLYAALAAHHPPSLEEAGDWRPHAAIILANSGARPDHDTRALTAFGDRLAARGLPYCAQFCYVAGGVGFARHPLAPLPPAGGAPAPAAPRLALLLAAPGARSWPALATPRAVLATEIYEYALSLHHDYCIPDLQVYKFVTACRLVDCGEYERALQYVEAAARAVTRAPHLYSPLLLRNLADMADRLKYHDPALLEDPPLLEEAAPAGAEGEASPRHQQWLADLQQVAHQVQAETTQPAAAAAAAAGGQHLHYSWEQAHQYQQQQQVQPAQAAPAPAAEPEEVTDYSQPFYPQPEPAPVSEAVPAPAPLEADVTSAAYSDWHRTEEYHAQTYGDSAGAGAGYWHHDNTYGYGESSVSGAGGGGGAEEANPRPMITMPGAHAPPAHSYGELDDDLTHNHQQQASERDSDTPKSSRAADAKSKDSAAGKSDGGKPGGGWLGGILTKLSLRPPNQMILPDDKNPTIVWDAEQKRWKNLDGEDAGSEQPPPPPPRLHPPQLHHQNTSTPNQSPSAAAAAGAVPPPPMSNIFKMQKGRHIKKSYVDVFNPGGGAARPAPAPAALDAAPAPAPAYFVPQPDPAQVGMFELSPAQHYQAGT